MLKCQKIYLNGVVKPSKKLGRGEKVLGAIFMTTTRRTTRNIPIVTNEPIKSEPAVKKIVKSKKKTVYTSASAAACLSIEEQNSIISSVLDRLDGKSIVLHGIERTKSSFLSNLKCAVKDNRGNSSILIGPRASGKSSLIKQLVKETIEENCQTHQIETFTLQGLIFPETNFVLKFLLSKFRSLLNISETSEETEEDVSEFMAFDQLTALVKQFFAPNLKVTKKKFIIFILEDLERFAAHPQQNLLYCLFELALSLPVFVVGTSCRIDVLELLEKRVKSRFSQNIVYLPLPSSKEEFIERITANLLVKDSTLYNESLTKNFIETNGLFGNLCNFHFEFTKDVRPIFRLLTQVYSSIPKDETFDWNKFSELFESIHGPVRPEIPLNSSILETTLVELMIVVSMCRLAAKFPSTPVTFDVMMEELSSCKQRASNLEHFCWLKSTIQVAFDRLINCRLLLLTSNSVNYGGANSSWTDRSYLTVRLGLPIFVILDSIERHQMMSKEIFALACEKF